MDSEDEKVQDGLDFDTDLISLPQMKAASTSSLDFDGLLQTPLKLHEDLSNGCGGQLWPAGMVLAKYMLRQRMKDVEGRSMFVHLHNSLHGLYLHLRFAAQHSIELGAGGGLVGYSIASRTIDIKTRECADFRCSSLALSLQSTAFRHPLWITDQIPMYELMQQNIELNGLQSVVDAKVYDWGEPTPEGLPKQPDIILAADCVYFEPAFPLLQRTLLDLIGDDTVCYFCFKKRRKADLHFVKAIKKLFDVREVNDDPDKHIWERQALFLYEIRKKTANR